MFYSGSFGLLLIRCIVGFVMFYHGSQKLFGWFDGPGIEAFAGMVGQMGLLPANWGIQPKWLAYAAAVSEFGGGILLMLGFATRFAAVFIAATMAVAVFKVHAHAFALSAKPPGMEYALTLMIVAIGLVFTGPGVFAVDRLFVRRKTVTTPPKKK
jgi:putative oxidoreductase